MTDVSLKEAIAELRAVVVSINAVISLLSGKDENPEEKKAMNITLEEVRASLVKTSRAGFREEVKALLTKYGAKTLSEVKPESYATLKLEAEELGNGK